MAARLAPHEGQSPRRLQEKATRKMTEQSAGNIAEKTERTREDALAELARFSPQNRSMEPEVARVVLMLASEDAKSIKGQAINIDGGAVTC